ncbi:General transcription factor II-I repeat domain-containing protein 2 [Thelohanellus kitauei]|uniref:General transcription factor II-I repeat domain-containing protein 2 n=1 Tax=Thelohanellus kitauei TaxID=669202 RepID=A0A0C2MBD7_THEKT|nr:General transcription factor II-I repeat domain-containing protein 2 [Thelohanellus kitauei]
MVDIKSHLNCLNWRLRGKDKLFTNLCDEVCAFKIKLRLFIREPKEGILDAFPTLKAHLQENTLIILQYRMKLESLLEALESRFDEFKKDKNNVTLFINPFLFPKQIFTSYTKTFNYRLLN